MNRDDIIRMARETGLCWPSDGWPMVPVDLLERFFHAAYSAGAAAARAEENEACAKVCDEKVDAEYATGKVDHNEMGWTQACAIAIRARSST